MIFLKYFQVKTLEMHNQRYLQHFIWSRTLLMKNNDFNYYNIYILLYKIIRHLIDSFTLFQRYDIESCILALEAFLNIQTTAIFLSILTGTPQILII